MSSKVARFPWVPALLVFVLIPLGVSASFSEPIAMDNSGIFSLTNLTPITTNDLDVTTTPATASFNVVTAGYFVVSSLLNPTSGPACLPGAGPRFDTSFTPPSSGFGNAPSSSGSGSYTSSSWTPSSTDDADDDGPQSTGSNPSSTGLSPQSISLVSTAGPLAPVPLPVPEPSTLLLVGLGLAVLGMRNYAVRPH